jgi:hypothetical protein
MLITFPSNIPIHIINIILSYTDPNILNDAIIHKDIPSIRFLLKYNYNHSPFYNKEITTLLNTHKFKTLDIFKVFIEILRINTMNLCHIVNEAFIHNRTDIIKYLITIQINLNECTIINITDNINLLYAIQYTIPLLISCNVIFKQSDYKLIETCIIIKKQMY